MSLDPDNAGNERDGGVTGRMASLSKTERKAELNSLIVDVDNTFNKFTESDLITSENLAVSIQSFFLAAC
jgi:hypothetical protein